MTKRQLIDEIIARNHSAQPGFLARFDANDLQDYLDHLCMTAEPRLQGDPHRYDKYFQDIPAVAVAEPPVAVEAAAVSEMLEDDDTPPDPGMLFQAEQDDGDLAATVSGGYEEVADPPEGLLADPPADVEAGQESPSGPPMTHREPVVRWREREEPQPARIVEPATTAAEDSSTPASGRPSAEAAAPQGQAVPPAVGQDEDTESWLF